VNQQADEEPAAEPLESSEPREEAQGAEQQPRETETPPRGPAERKRPDTSRADRQIALRRLVELAAKYAEVGPPLAELAFAIGETDIGNQLVRLGTDRETPHMEYWFVAANAARRERRYEEVVQIVSSALRTVAARPDVALAAGEEDRLLHLVRIGFATLMFDLRQLTAESPMAQALAETLPGLEPRLGASPFYRTLLAQTLWFTDRAASEAQWDRADQLGDAETTWNARGTWYNEAEHDLDRAEQAYRKGLEKVGGSALLMHNLAQILVEKAKRPGVSPSDAHRLLNQATEQLRLALRQDAPRLRRHIHATRDRLEDFRRRLPMPERRGGGGPGPRFRGGGDRPGDRPGGGGGGGGPRDRGPRRETGRAPSPGGGPPRGPRPDRETRRPPQPEQKFLQEGTVSLGEMILAKLKEKDSR